MRISRGSIACRTVQQRLGGERQAELDDRQQQQQKGRPDERHLDGGDAPGVSCETPKYPHENALSLLAGRAAFRRDEKAGHARERRGAWNADRPPIATMEFPVHPDRPCVFIRIGAGRLCAVGK